ncbi:MAG: Rrf2 family transcriptional regulator [Ruthenibacterium lactatiformans]
MMASQEVVVVDVRTRDEYDGGHIENAVLVPNESIGSEMPETLPDKDATLLIYCRGGPPQQGRRGKAAIAGVSESLRLRRRHRLALRACEGGIIVDSSFNLAVHALVCLSHSGRSLSSEALAENICTNPTRVRRVMAGLKAGMVETREGLDGGYRLTADPASLTLRQVAEAVNTRFVDCAWHSGDIDRNCAICSGMAGVMDTLYRQMNEQCAAYLSHITITDIETQLFAQK